MPPKKNKANANKKGPKPKAPKKTPSSSKKRKTPVRSRKTSISEEESKISASQPKIDDIAPTLNTDFLFNAPTPPPPEIQPLFDLNDSNQAGLNGSVQNPSYLTCDAAETLTNMASFPTVEQPTILPTRNER